MTLPRRNGKRQSNREFRQKLNGPQRLCKARMRNGLCCGAHALPNSDWCWLHKTMLEMPALPGDTERILATAQK